MGSVSDKSYDGALISELGIKNYLKGREQLATANVSFFDRDRELNRKWDECNFGCHGPSYRNYRRSITWHEVLAHLDKVDPFVAGVVDGIHHKTVHQGEMLSEGLNRTAEGLHLKGNEAFSDVGSENWATADLIKTTFWKIVEFDLSLIENPLMQTMIVLINEYVSSIPEWVIEDMVGQDVLKFTDNFDKAFILKAAKYGVIQFSNSDELDGAINYLQGRARRVVGKQMGKKLWVIISGIIATKIVRQILSNSFETVLIKRQLVKLRKISKAAKGGPATALFGLLKAQGVLGSAAKSSRSLKESCPKIWQVLRHKMHGSDMVYFLVQPMVQEYVDRLALLQKQPEVFVRVIAALLKDRKTQDIFYPRISTNM